VIERTWTTKACDISASVCQKITIVDTTPPYFVCSDTKFQVQCGDDYSPDTLGYPDVYDKCDQHVKLTYQDEETYGDCPVVKIVKRVWTATDDCGNKSYFIQWIYISDSKGPAWKWFPDDCYRDCKETCSVNDCGTPKAYDSCSQVQVYVDKEYDVPNPDGCGKTTIRVWVAKDACGLNITRNQKIVIKDKTLPYWVSFPDNYTLGCKDDTSPSKCGYPKANDDCSGVCDISYKDYNFDGKCPYAKTIKRVWTAKDKCGNAITKTQYIYINDIKAPYFKDIKNQTLECDKPNSCEDLGGYPIVWDNCSPPEKINVTYKEWTYPGECPSDKVIKRVWRAEDECGNVAYQDQYINSKDTTPPSWKWKPPTCPVTCAEDTSPEKCGRPTAIDKCDKYPDIRYEDEDCPEDGCPYLKTIKRTWSVKDCVGNRGESFVQLITVAPSPPSDVAFQPFCLWPPNHFYYAVKNLTNSGLVTSTSTCKNYPGTVYIKAAYCSSNQAENALGDGNFCKDCYYSAADDTLYIRAERAGNIKTDRVYTVGLIVVDSLDPQCKTFTKKVEGYVTVPHDQRDHPECVPANTNKK
jgi:hypothetical protein